MPTRADVLDLAGNWAFALGDSPGFGQTLQLPGSLQAQGFGDEVSLDTPWTGRIIDRAWFTDDIYAPYRQPGRLKIPFWLQPEKHYIGAAWYRRDVEIPAAWAGRRVTLFLERAHIETRVWLDDREIGSCNSLSTPHVYELGVDLPPGLHRLTLRVDNRLQIDVGVNSHSVTDHSQTNWNGLIGRVELRAGAPVWIEDAQVHPRRDANSVHLEVRIGNATGRAGSGTLFANGTAATAMWDEQGGALALDIPFDFGGGAWSEFSTVLHSLDLRLGDDTRTVTFGARDARVEGTQLLMNGKPLFLRGTVECCVFPRTGYPPMALDEWRRILGIVKSHGLNHVRFHSWCPPEAAFAAADTLGVYLQVECASWANASTALGKGEPVDAWVHEETARILRAYGNHPSFLLMAYGNEPGRVPADFTDYLRRWVRDWKQRDPRRLYTSAAGWPAIAENDYHNIPEPRIQAWGEELRSRINAKPPATTADYRIFTDMARREELARHLQPLKGWNDEMLEAPRPIIAHETGQWCVYPDFSEIPKYDGVLKARNFEIFKETLAAHHLGDQAPAFLAASGFLQVLCYKEEIESALRTPGFGGFQLLQANDFPGQGTAPVGWLNAFWESKGYTTPESFRRFNNSTVPLARFDQRVFCRADTLRAELEVAHYGAAPLENARLYWLLKDESGGVHARGEFPVPQLPLGLSAIGPVEISLAALPAPCRYTLVAGLADTPFENDWDFWVYPSAALDVATPEPPILHDWAEVLRPEARGRRVLLNPPASCVAGGVALGFSSIFWNTAWTRKQAPHTLGILCDPSHPALAHFPTEFHSNWQWWELIHGGAAFVLDGLPPALRPVVQVIDDWFTNRRLGLVIEVRVNGCELILCGSDLGTDLPHRHAARQFRASLLTRLARADFRPAIELSEGEFRQLFIPRATGAFDGNAHPL
ncbi:MAG TPA: glycoside hydrolase family 2 TIM barrel-domain containing protein [Kiritimatiellia bacterium]|nr:glycoside hydrolase family 2 TIM barrel-domain containing protein [Kiritimatiellia bacterium]